MFLSEHTNLKTTLNSLRALNHLRGEPGSVQDALHHDAQMAHYFRGVLDRIHRGETDPIIASSKALGFVIGQGEPLITAEGGYIHQNAD